MLKLYATLAAADEESPKKEGIASKKTEEKMPNKLISRPQFLEFLVRLAIEKWCSFSPKKNNKVFVDKFKKFEEEEKKMLNLRREVSKSIRLVKLDRGESKSKNVAEIKNVPTIIISEPL